jgi:acetyltransferase-like isoleucine patch superfamily enzyme
MRTRLRTLVQSLRRLLFVLTPGVRVADSARLEARVVLRPGFRDGRRGEIGIGPACVLDTGAHLDAWGGSIELGREVYVGPGAVLYGQGGLTVGDATLVSMHCRILSSNHRVPGLDRRIRWETDELLPTRIGSDVWLGAGVTVLGGVTIGDGCVVGAGAVVTRDLPPGSIAYGVPATVRGMRPSATPRPE